MNEFRARLSSATTAERRQIVRTNLMGGHTHVTLQGVQVHIWLRGDKYLARGSYEGHRFGETLGVHPAEATARLRQLLTEIEDGSYVRPQDARKRLLSRGKVPRLSLRALVNEFLAEKRKVRGRQTAGDYQSSLAAVLDFAELPANRKKWPLALDIDRSFVTELRSFLFQYRTTRNGRPSGPAKHFSGRQVINVLECLRTVLTWARKADVRKLPAEWAQPLTPDLVGSPPVKDPLREDKLPMGVRIKLVEIMDTWQLCQLGVSLVLPLRPDEAAGLLVSDVNFERGWLEFGDRLKDTNFTKEGTAFKLPFPPQLRPVLCACIQQRVDGPLFRNRKAFEQGITEVSASTGGLQNLYEDALLGEPPDAVQTAHDRKLVFRRMLRQLGGVSEDTMNKEFKKLLAVLGVGKGATVYTLRSSVTTAMKSANLPHLEMRYLTSHSTNDILNE